MPPILLLAPEYLHSLAAPNTPLTSLIPPNDPLMPYTPKSLQYPLCHLYHFWPLSTYISCQPPMHPSPPDGTNAPDTPTPPKSPQYPLCYLYPFWPLSTYTPCQPPIHPLMAPQHALTPLQLLVFYLSLCN